MKKKKLLLMTICIKDILALCSALVRLYVCVSLFARFSLNRFSLIKGCCCLSCNCKIINYRTRDNTKKLGFN